VISFTVEDAGADDAGCIKCCCPSVALKPGTISRVAINYAPWSVPIGRLNCDPQFVLEQMETCPASAGSNLPPQPAAKVSYDVQPATLFNGDLNTQVTDPEGDPLTYKWLPTYGPTRGKLVLRTDGTFDYTPEPNYTGADRFFASVSDGINAAVVFEVVLGVGTPAANIPATPHVSINSDGVQVDSRLCLVSFPLKVSPAARTCEVWRMTVLQGALDCDCICYQRSDCYDIRVAKC
jgi:hypothetical protein